MVGLIGVVVPGPPTFFPLTFLMTGFFPVFLVGKVPFPPTIFGFLAGILTFLATFFGVVVFFPTIFGFLAVILTFLATFLPFLVGKVPFPPTIFGFLAVILTFLVGTLLHSFLASKAAW